MVGIEEEDEGPDDKIRFLYGKRSRPNFLEGIVAREATVFNVRKTLTFMAASALWAKQTNQKIFLSINYQFWSNFKIQLSPLWL